MQNESFPNFWNFRPGSCPNFAPNFPRIFRGFFVPRFVGNGDQKKFTQNPRHFSVQNSQANTKKIFTKCFWREGKVRNQSCEYPIYIWMSVLIDSGPKSSSVVARRVARRRRREACAISCCSMASTATASGAPAHVKHICYPCKRIRARSAFQSSIAWMGKIGHKSLSYL